MMFKKGDMHYWGLAELNKTQEVILPLEALPTDVNLFNEAIGLPIHPRTGLPHKLLDYQLEIMRCQYNDIQVEKSIKIGVSEAIIRMILQRCVDTRLPKNYAGYQVMLGAQVYALAVENLSRMTELFDGSKLLQPFLAQDPTHELILLKNKTEIFPMPKSANAIRGYQRVKCVWLDEAAHTGLIDDREILAASLGRLANTQGDLITSSTPKGMRGFFWERHALKERGEAEMRIFHLPYWVALGTLISEDWIAEQKAKFGTLFSQEFEAQFITSESAAFPSDFVEGNRDDYEAWNL